LTPGSAGIEIVHEAIDVERLKELAAARFGDLVKAVVDVRQGIMAIGCELHADEEAVLLDAGSVQADLWGINLYPADHGMDGWLEYDSMIDVRPGQANRSRSVDDPAIRDRIATIVEELVR